LDVVLSEEAIMKQSCSVLPILFPLRWAAVLGAVLTLAHSLPAQIWVSNSALPDGLWCAASSADGTRLIAAGWPSIYTSTNSGATWTSNNAPAEWWSTVASSADGTALVSSSGYGGGPLYTTTNAGATWISNSLPASYWSSVASSADGTKLAAVVDAGGIYTSTNSGAIWVSNSAIYGSWMSVASSADGNTLVALTQNGLVCGSTNAGATWVPNYLPGAGPSTGPYGGVASSADGTGLLATVENAPLCTSTNSGLSWNPVGGSSNSWLSAASSADGKTLVAASGFPGQIYISTDAGATWASAGAPSADWWSVACSADGTRLAAIGSGHLYTWQPAPTLSSALSNGNLVLSWPSSALSFWPQQNADLTTTNWLTLSNVQTTSSGGYSVTVPVPGSNCFYRLSSF
jgi:hypothetical protein